MRTALLSVLLPLGLVLACGDKDGGGGDDTGDGGATDGGTQDGGSGVETGCITVDGGGSYAWLTDALAAAADGAVISLEACTGTHTEEVEVDRPVTIRGNADVTLTADGAVPLTVTADGVVLSGLQVTSSRNGVLIDGAADVSLLDVSVYDPGGWGVRADDATGLELSGLLVSGAEDGGVRISGGSAEIVGAELTGMYGYGLRILEGASVSLSGSTIRNVTTTGAGSTQDGVGISVEGGSLQTADNLVEDVLAWGIYAEEATLRLQGDELVGGTMGVLALDSTVEGSGLTVHNPLWTGVYVYNEVDLPVTLTGLQYLADEGAVDPVDPDTWFDQAYVGAGLFLVADQVDLSDSTLTGSPGVAALVSGVTSATASIDGVTISDVSQYGLYLAGGTFTATDLTVDGVRAYEASVEDRCSAVDQDVGVLLIEADLDWSGGTLRGSEGYGLTGIYGDATVQGITVADNGCAGLMAFLGGLSLSDSEVSGHAGTFFGAGVTGYQATSLEVTGTWFHDNAAEVLDWSYDYSGGVRHDYYAWFGSDVQVYYGGAAEIHGNTFERGVGGVEVYSDASLGSSSANLSENSFSSYKGATLVSYGGSTVVADGHTVEGFGVSAIYCEDATLTLGDAAVATGGTLTERYEIYEGDVLTDTSAIASNGPALYAADCALEVDGLEISDTDAWAVYLEGGTNTLRNLTTDITGRTTDTDAVSIYATNTDGTLQLSGAQISQADRYGLVGYASGAASLAITATGVQVDRAGVVDLFLQNDSPTTATAAASISASAFTESGAVGIYTIDFELGLNEVTVGSNNDDGIYLDGGRADIKGTTVYDNLGYGLYCASSVEFTNCELEFSGNSAGDTQGCDPACSGEDEVVDTGWPD